MNRSIQRHSGNRGFTLPELLISSAVSLIVVAAALVFHIYVFKTWRVMDQRIQADQDINNALSRMVYGVEGRRGLRAAREMSVSSDGQDWTLSYVTGYATRLTNSFTYSASEGTLTFNPGNRLIAGELAAAEVALLSNTVTVTLRVDRVSGGLRVQRALGTGVVARN